MESLERRALLSVKIQFDYSLDTNGFFNDATRRATLQAAADSITARLGDTLNAIGPAGTNQWSMIIRHPGTGSGHLLSNPTVPADIVRVYAGGRPVGGFPSGRQAEAFPAAENFTSVTNEWRRSVISRGEPGALIGYDGPAWAPTDIAPSIGSISFNSAAKWHFGATSSGLGADEYDLHSAAVHELARILGFGGSTAWQRLVAGTKFTGTAAVNTYGASVPLASIDFVNDHWAEGTSSGGQEAAMDPTLKLGTRKSFTPLDFAGLDDIGWELLPVPSNTASIAGNLFNDLDSDGVKDSGEGALSNWKVFLDADKDGVLDSGEKTATTDSSGNYKFTALAAGSYRVREVTNSGWRRTAPSSGYFDVTLTSGQASTGKNFGNTQKVLISGTLFNDLDGDGTKDSGEGGLSNWKVYLDSDKDGVWDSTEKYVMTNTSGSYTFKTLAAGSYRVREVLPSGWRRTTPSSGYFDLTLSNGGSSTGKNFGNTQKILISGTVFNDLDGDKIKDSGEVGLSGWKVFIDSDSDGVWDSSEKYVTTSSSGSWSFKNLAAGTYRVRVVQQTGWTRTTPTSGYHSVTLSSGGSSTGKLFGEKK